MKLKKILAADEAHPDYEKYKRKQEEYRHEYFEEIHALKSKELPDEEEDLEFKKITQERGDKMKALGQQYEQIFTIPILLDEDREGKDYFYSEW